MYDLMPERLASLRAPSFRRLQRIPEVQFSQPENGGIGLFSKDAREISVFKKNPTALHGY